MAGRQARASALERHGPSLTRHDGRGTLATTMHTAVLAVFLAVVTGTLAPAAALAEPGRHLGQRPHGGRHVVTGSRPGHVHPHRHTHRPFASRGYSRSPYSPYVYGAGYYAPPLVYGASLGHDFGSSSSYDPPLVYTLPPAAASITTFMAAPPQPSVVEYSTGRYELRGDGISTPPAWVWIPNPPPPPEPPAESRTAIKAELPSPPATSAGASPRPRPVYRWVDERGVVHLTDNPESVPRPYRTPAAGTAQGGAS
jgi:hypothetical protein